MFVTPSGITMLSRDEQPQKAVIPISVTLPSTGITLFLHPKNSFLLSVSIKQLPWL